MAVSTATGKGDLNVVIVFRADGILHTETVKDASLDGNHISFMTDEGKWWVSTFLTDEDASTRYERLLRDNYLYAADRDIYTHSYEPSIGTHRVAMSGVIEVMSYYLVEFSTSTDKSKVAIVKAFNSYLAEIQLREWWNNSDTKDGDINDITKITPMVANDVLYVGNA